MLQSEGGVPPPGLLGPAPNGCLIQTSATFSLEPKMLHVGQTITATVTPPKGGAMWSWDDLEATLGGGSHKHAHCVDHPGPVPTTAADSCKIVVGPGVVSTRWQVYSQAISVPLLGGFAGGVSSDYFIVTKAPFHRATLELAGHAHTGLSVDATITASDRLTNATVRLSLSPSDYLSHVSGARIGKSGGKIEATEALGTLGAGKRVLRISADLASLFARAGQTVHGMNAVGGDSHWSHAAQAPATTGGDELIFSDSPEYLLGKEQIKVLKDGKKQKIAATELPNGQVAGNQVEGILYKQTDQSASGDFRVYLNHENRTPVPKLICVVITPTADSAELTQEAVGEGEKPGDPVVAGALALAAYETDRRAPTPQTVTLGADHPAYDKCFGPIVNSGAAGVINAIIDFHSSAPVKVGVVAVNSDRDSQFESNPLGYEFADAKHPTGDPSRTYATDGPLHNPGESHVAGTFGYDEVTVAATVNLDDAEPFGMLLAGDPKKMPRQYKAALDNHNPDNKGNYGVFYHVIITVTGSSSERAEVVFNPRGVGPNPQAGVTNAFAGIADVPSSIQTGSAGREIHIPSGGAIKHSQDGTVLGSVNGGQSFSFDFMPPGGAVSPDAIVVLPEFVRVEGTLDFKGGSAIGTPDPLLIELR